MGLLRYLPATLQAILIMFTGVVILLYTLDLVQAGLKYFIMFVAVYMIVDGFIALDGIEKVRALLAKTKSGTPKE
jgi:TRAP-type C4-dicarboxylate transport system permease small subunit